MANDDIVARLCTRLSGLVLDLRSDEQNDAADDVQLAITALAERDATIERLTKVAEQAQEDRRTLRYETACLRERATTAERERDEARAEVERLYPATELPGNSGLLEDRIAAALYADGSDLCDVPWEFVPDHMKIGYFSAARRVLAACAAKGGENAEG